ncbi:unnamed protein product [Prunus brigantina]
MGCLGVSMDLVCYVKGDSSNAFRFWSYDDRCDQWTLRFTLCRKISTYRCMAITFRRLKPYAISPNSHEFFFGTPILICSYDFKSEMVTFVHEPKSCEIAPPDYHLPFFALRACLISLGERNVGSTQL